MIIEKHNIFLGDLPEDQKPNLAIFLSGSGSNAEKLLADIEIREAVNIVVLVTDAPEKSRAAVIAEKYDLPLVALSIREFYRQHGLNTISLATERGREVRELWTGELRRQLKGYSIDFGVLAGFEPLSNITGDFPCLNVHPGDLTKTDAAGNRLYVGLHSRPVEKAILSGETALRSSVIIALSFTDANKDMDNGILLGVSQAMDIDFQGLTLQQLQQINDAREGKKPAGGWKDQLEMLALRSQEELKLCGDHKLLPPVVRDFAKKCFAWQDNKLYYRPAVNADFIPMDVPLYSAEGKMIY